MLKNPADKDGYMEGETVKGQVLIGNAYSEAINFVNHINRFNPVGTGRQTSCEHIALPQPTSKHLRGVDGASGCLA
ncbi:hypothetical protein RvY_12056 [Ramazzottius varieornatus]|uniref:Uncharacterized protein n=1 Tax=Ramazzottius varieornatus TaxID=947166 RepID=A0A1D1VMG2_RAMVA|nr:hypothetical protein RvY_12056 [Ramazzottius varieornatus]